LQSTKEDKTMNDREKTTYRPVNYRNNPQQITHSALARLEAHRHRQTLRECYFCWALVKAPK